MVPVPTSMATAGQNGSKHLPCSPILSTRDSLQPKTANLLGLLHANPKGVWRLCGVNLSWCTFVPCR